MKKHFAAATLGVLFGFTSLSYAADVAPSPTERQQQAEQGQEQGRTGETKQSVRTPDQSRKDQQKQGRIPDVQGKERSQDTGRTPPPASDAGAGTAR
ncbi:MAG: hypothetical protein E6K60_05525 [Nitrospirae bacterium]|nr:MAG: hypothetical protein E6K60_05525 [Nitrospirota bacterium]